MLTDKMDPHYCNALLNLLYHTVVFLYIPDKNCMQELKFTLFFIVCPKGILK